MSQTAITTIEDSIDDSIDEPRGSNRHREVLIVCSIVVVLAFLLEVLPDQRVAFRGWEQYPLPPMCRSREWFGLSCPGCGLTRSIVHLAHADWRSSIRLHRLGWVMAVVIVFQVPYRALLLFRAGSPRFGPRTEILLSSLLIALLIGNWLYNLVTSKP